MLASHQFTHKAINSSMGCFSQFPLFLRAFSSDNFPFFRNVKECHFTFAESTYHTSHTNIVDMKQTGRQEGRAMEMERMDYDLYALIKMIYATSSHSLTHPQTHTHIHMKRKVLNSAPSPVYGRDERKKGGSKRAKEASGKLNMRRRRKIYYQIY